MSTRFLSPLLEENGVGKIRILDRSVAEHIAAGEVVDRPASILKELLENALDAESTRIEADIAGGGIERISVSDNGCGMDEGDAALSLQRHATSKLAALDDLERIATYGFRGEALASIAAVSRVTLLTREADALHGTRIEAEGGEIRTVEPAGCPPGTHIEMRDLFFNVPARRKFLKSPQTEESAFLDLLGKIALARCDAAFQIRKNGKIVSTLTPNESLRERYLKLFPQTEENQIFPLEAVSGSMSLRGIIAGPLFSKSNRNGMLLYVNQRYVRPGVVAQAVLDGYSGYLQAGKFPVTVLFLSLDGQFVDVNVHPTKAEVRFSHPKEVYAFVEKSVAARLREIQEEVRPHVIPYFVPDSIPPAQKYQDLTLFESLAPYEPKKAVPVILGSVARTYGLFQEEETLYLVDLHNAHERLNFDLLESRAKHGGGAAQELLSPLMISLSAAQELLVAKYGSFFASMGLSVEGFGSGSALLRSVPPGLEQLGQKQFFLSLLDRLSTVDDLKEPEAIRRKIVVTMACRSSIQAGDELSVHEMQSLFEKLLRSSNPYFCPHGRPIIIKLTLDEVHKLFRRR